MDIKVIIITDCKDMSNEKETLFIKLITKASSTFATIRTIKKYKNKVNFLFMNNVLNVNIIDNCYFIKEKFKS